MEFIGSFKLYALLQIVTLSLLIAVGIIANLGSFFYLDLMAMSGFFIYQQYLTRHRDKCFKAFLNNHYAGFTVFIALVLNYL